MDKYEAFEKLKEFSQDLSDVSYDEIVDLLKNGIKFIPVPLAKVQKNAHIDRVRPNKGSVLYEHIDNLGYIKEQEVIDKHLLSFGRANCPHQVMFYGALESTLIDKQRLTAIAETSDLFRENKDCPDGKYYTVSRWKTNDEFLVVEVVFSEYALENNPDIRASFEKQKRFLLDKGLEEKEIRFHLDFLKFISEEFSKKVTNADDYKISAAYTNIILLHPETSGITYPSVQTQYFGVNIVLTPEAVDKYLMPLVCSTQIVYKNGEKTVIANGGHFCDNIDITNKIEWKEQDESLLTNKDEILKHLYS
ncbi:hypothetical protein LRS05_15875 [Flavobacterium sp. J372]|uniref:hypothetical protein n=1 Tax=Flavobacterium sp. J372 TaxID=2898436 RepID=UPI002151D2F8|nr:hypothetical protein [Flavobacterium sp. J372]MCR5863506.1 hypothetical protein [Flavobacterium sp. J372]